MYLYYSLLAALCLGIHIFSIKWIKLNYEANIFILFIAVSSLFFWIFSRYFIVQALNYTSHITNIHLLLLCSIFVTFILDKLFYKSKVNLLYFFLALLFIFSGFYILECSVIH